MKQRTLAELKELLPAPTELRTVLQETAESDEAKYDYYLEVHEPYEIYIISQGGGDEAQVIFYMENGEAIAALINIYMNEGSDNTTPNISVSDGEEYHQPALVGIPHIFLSAVNENSPILWKWEGYPATFNRVFSSGTIWCLGDSWDTPPYATLTGYKDRPINQGSIAQDTIYMLKDVIKIGNL